MYVPFFDLVATDLNRSNSGKRTGVPLTPLRSGAAPAFPVPPVPELRTSPSLNRVGRPISKLDTSKFTFK